MSWRLLDATAPSSSALQAAEDAGDFVNLEAQGPRTGEGHVDAGRMMATQVRLQPLCHAIARHKVALIPQCLILQSKMRGDLGASPRPPA